MCKTEDLTEEAIQFKNKINWKEFSALNKNFKLDQNLNFLHINSGFQFETVQPLEPLDLAAKLFQLSNITLFQFQEENENLRIRKSQTRNDYYCLGIFKLENNQVGARIFTKLGLKWDALVDLLNKRKMARIARTSKIFKAGP